MLTIRNFDLQRLHVATAPFTTEAVQGLFRAAEPGFAANTI
jgi:hypothetical protein